MGHNIVLIADCMEVVCLSGSSNESDDKLELNLSEYKMLVFLLANMKTISTRGQLLEQGWPGKFVTENSLNVSIMKLRKKMDSFCCDITVKTYPGQGYKVIVPSDVQIDEYNSYEEFYQAEQAIEDENNTEITNDLDFIEKKERSKKVMTEVTKPHSIFNLFTNNQMLIIYTSMMLLTAVLFFILYTESFVEFHCDDPSVCSFLQEDDL